MVNVVTEIEIECPLNKVAEYSANPQNAPEWYVNIKRVEWKTPHRLEVGSKIAFEAHFLGRKLQYVYEFVEFIPNQKLVMRTADGPFPMETTYTWTSIENGNTKMTLRNRGEPKGFSKWVSPFISMTMKKANKNDLERLKMILE